MNWNSILPLFVLTTLAMIAFAANSVLARAALLGDAIDPASFVFLRLLSGALMLAILVFWSERQSARRLISNGNLISAFCLFAYAATFSFAYIKLGTGIGALILFACVQATMIGWALYKGDRPIALEWLGLVIAFAAFVWLVSPGLAAPDPFSAALMVLSGIAWGVYSLRGRGAKNPLRATAGNFILAVPMGLVLLIGFAAQLSYSGYGVILAIISGAITSGIGYSIWYRVLPQISAMQGGLVQLTVPVIAGIGGLIWSGEPFSVRFIVASTFILGGVGMALVAKAKRG